MGLHSEAHIASIAGQHLLSAVCDEVAGADTISWELHPRPTSSDSSDSVCIDLAVPHLSSEQLQVSAYVQWMRVNASLKSFQSLVAQCACMHCAANPSPLAICRGHC